MNSKVCTVCGEDKPLTEYNPKNKRGHFRSECKVCQRARDRGRRQDPAFSERHQELSRKWRQENKVKFAAGEIDMPATKRCYKCKRVKSFEEFSQNPYNNDGLQGYCKECVNEYNAVYRARRNWVH